MKYACNNCGARYALPDSRVMAAGEQGLRIRCSRCRAIMAVCFGDRANAAGDDSIHGDAHDDADITQPIGFRRKHSQRDLGSDQLLQALPTEVGMAAAAAGPAPAVLSPTGSYRPLPGVGRGVTGVHMPATGAAMPGRDWYAAFGGRARGPYSRAELELLAEQGRVRSSTLIWRPGFGEWQRVKGEGQRYQDEIAWLRGIVDDRKRRERSASSRAAREHGIHRLHLDDFSSPPKTPPPLPAHEPAGMADKRSASPHVLFIGRSLPARSSRKVKQRPLSDFAADRVFGAPRLGESRVHEVARRERQRRQHALAFTAGALLAGLAVVVATYTLPALGLSLADVIEALRSLTR